MIQVKFAENLRTVRIAKKMTQKDLAVLLGVDQRTVSAWEKGVCEPNFQTLALLCEYFDESFDNILT